MGMFSLTDYTGAVVVRRSMKDEVKGLEKDLAHHMKPCCDHSHVVVQERISYLKGQIAKCTEEINKWEGKVKKEGKDE